MARNSTHYDGDLAADLVAAGLRVIEADGPSAVSIRSLARELGVSNAAPKNHFTDKAALFAAIALDGFVGLADRLDAVGLDHAGAEGDPGALLVDAGVAYVAHALEHPAHFAVMWQADLHGDPPGVVEARIGAYQRLLDIVSKLDPDESVDRANRAWALAHGWATLLLSGSLTVPDGVEPLEYVRRQLAADPVATPLSR